MMELTVEDGTAHIMLAEPLPRILQVIAADLGTGPVLTKPGPLVSNADAETADPLANLEVEEAAADLAQRLAAAGQQAEQVARTVLDRWAARPARDGVITDTLTAEEVSLLANWANRHYQAIRIAELDAAGIEVQVGSSSGVDDLLADILGPSPDDPSTVEMTPPCAVFGMVSVQLSGALRAMTTQ